MRERLIELLGKADKAGVEYIDELDHPMELEEAYAYIADYLLENGVIVPPIQLGQRVWFENGTLNEVCEATVIRVEYNYFTSPQEWIEIEYYSSIIGEHKYKSRIDLMIGKTVFLTREEAEQALKEREKT